MILLASGLIWTLIRLPHRRRARKTPIARSARGPLEYGLIALALAGSWLGMAYAAARLLLQPEAFPLLGDYPFAPAQGWVGLALTIAAMALFALTHRDLGRSWSMSLDTRADHVLVTTGVYARVRHPMYSAFFLWFLAQALLIPNWIAGPAGLVAFTILFAVRVPREERLMLDAFGEAYRDYMRRTHRLVPGLY